MKRYIALTEEGSCGHMHRHEGRALDCLDRFEDHGIRSHVAYTTENLHPIWIDKQLSKIGMKRLKVILEA
jgi:hypothetical protein